MACLLKGGGGLYNRLALGAVVLAAGRGSRLGNRAKALIELVGIPLIRRQLIALSGAGVDQLVVVLGHYASQIRPFIEDFPITVVDLSDNPEASQKLSTQRGVSALQGKFDAVLVVPSDMPLLGTADYTDLSGAYKKRPDGARMVRPIVNESPGNPVIFDYAIIEQSESSTEPLCRHWWHKHPEQCHGWRTVNDRFAIDLDTFEDVTTVEARLGRQLVVPEPVEVISGNA